MKDDIRRVLTAAAPFAGVALGWYLFMPSFEPLTYGIYRSQAYLDLVRLSKVAEELKYKLTTPKEIRDYTECRLAAGWDLLDRKVKDASLASVTLEEYGLQKCGPDPRNEKGRKEGSEQLP